MFLILNKMKRLNKTKTEKLKIIWKHNLGQNQYRNQLLQLLPLNCPISLFLITGKVFSHPRLQYSQVFLNHQKSQGCKKSQGFKKLQDNKKPRAVKKILRLSKFKGCKNSMVKKILGLSKPQGCKNSMVKKILGLSKPQGCKISWSSKKSCGL